MVRGEPRPCRTSFRPFEYKEKITLTPIDTAARIAVTPTGVNGFVCPASKSQASPTNPVFEWIDSTSRVLLRMRSLSDCCSVAFVDRPSPPSEPRATRLFN